MKNERYYYGKLTPDGKRIYKRIYNGLKRYQSEIGVDYGESVTQIQGIYRSVLYDNPLLFYVNQRVTSMAVKSDGFVLLPEYLYSPEESLGILQKIRWKVDRVVEGAEKFKDCPLQVEKYLHDSVIKSVVYDDAAFHSLMFDHTVCDRAHSVVGAFLDNKAVCEGIAKTFKLLCNVFAIKCVVVLGKAEPEGEFSGQGYHAWNLVKIGDTPYHVDVTWDAGMDDKGNRYLRYDYFNVTTEKILQDHQPVDILELEGLE